MIGYNPIIQPNSYISFQKKSNPQVKDNSHKNDVNMAIDAAIGLSLVTFCTVAGLYYFSKHPSGLKNNSKIHRNFDYSTKTINDFPNYYETKAEEVIGSNLNIKTMDNKPTWNAVTTAFKPVCEEESVKTAAGKNKNTKRNWREEKKSEITPGIIRQVSTGIKDYIKKCGIDRQHNKINPEALDEILTNAVGKEHVIERPYLENGKHGLGRVKEYTSPNGRVYVLETHDSSKGIVTRLYMHDKDKHLRAYLHADGTFRLNSYTSDESHFSTTAKGKRWMESSKFLKKTEPAK